MDHEITIVRIDLIHKPGAVRALVTARIDALDILLRCWQIVMGARGRLYVQAPYRQTDDATLSVVLLPDRLRTELKKKALAAYFAQGGEGRPGEIDSTSEERRRHRRTKERAGLDRFLEVT